MRNSQPITRPLPLRHHAVLCLFLLSPCSYAALEQEVSNIRIDGFASFAGGAIMGSEGFRRNAYDEDIRFDQDSLIATQIKADMGDKLTATTQFLGKAANGYDVELEWAFLNYQLSPQWNAKVGRVVSANHIYSDYSNVGYSYHWINPPSSLYDLPFENLEGFHLEHRAELGNWNSRLGFIAGTTEEDFAIGSERTTFQIRNGIGSSLTLSNDYLSLRMSLAESGKTTAPYSLLFNPANIDAPNTLTGDLRAAALADGQAVTYYDDIINDIRTNDDRVTLAAIGAVFEYKQYLAVAEYTKVEPKHSIFADKKNYYISLGQYFDKLLIHLTYEVNKETAKSELATRLENIIPNSIANKAALVSTVRTLAQQLAFDSESWSIGLRYDFHSSADFKLEYTQQQDHLSNTTPELLLLGIDVVF